MAHQATTATNWYIQDANGQPQMIKVLQTGGKPLVAAGQTIKFVTESDSQGVPTGQRQVFKIASPQKLITKLPVSQLARIPDGQLVHKTIRIATNGQIPQMQNVKLTTQRVTVPAITTPIIQQVVNQQKYISPPILDHSGARKRQDTIDLDLVREYKRRKTEKIGKGLRHFSMKVCEKVKLKKTTSYNEVADELVGEFTSALNSPAEQQYDQKNIRRRVYDALNVLMAMNIISKEKKEIRWLGLPTNTVQECLQLQKEKDRRILSIREKAQKLNDLVLNQVAFKNLALRNRNRESTQGPPAPNSYIQLPFIVVNTNKKTIIDCSISNDKMEYLFNFSDKFEIHDDAFVLKDIGMLMGLDKGDCTPNDLEKIKKMVPKALESYVIQLANGRTDQVEDVLQTAGAGPSHLPLLNAEDLVETQMDDENSRQSSSSYGAPAEYSEEEEEEGGTDYSSDNEAN